MRKIILIAALAAAIGAPSYVQAADSMGEKLQPYIACLNEFSSPAYSSRGRYLKWAAESGPTGKEMPILGVTTISDPAKCTKDIATANADTPHDKDLEAAGTAFTDSLTALAPLLKEAENYYKQEDYKDDNMAKGKAMHPKLMAAWADFDKADQTLHGIVDKLNDEAAAQELADVEKKEGRSAHYLVLNIMGNAKKVTRLELDDDNPEPDKIQPALETLDKATQELDQYVEAHKDTGFGTTQILKQSKDLVTAAKKYMRRIRDKTPLSHTEQLMMSSGAGFAVDGGPAAVGKGYNDLVDAYNRSH